MDLKENRFEVFRRDGFKCCICGQSVPEVTLIVKEAFSPRPDGDMKINKFLTCCFDCNGLKKNDPVGMDELNEKAIQLAEMINWKEEFYASEDVLKKKLIEAAAKEWSRVVNGSFGLSNDGIEKLAELIERYGLSLVVDSMKVVSYQAKNKEGFFTLETCDGAFEKIGAICFSKTQSEDMQELYYIRGIAKNRHETYNPVIVLERLKIARAAGVKLDDLLQIAKTSKSWWGMSNMIDRAIQTLNE